MQRPSRKPRFDPNATLATIETGRAMQAILESKLGDLTSKNDEAAKFAFDESKASYELTRERFKNLDAKAVTLTGIVTTGLGAVALLGDPTKVPEHAFWLYVALAALCGALVAALLSLAPQATANPDLSPYVWPATLANTDNLARLRVHVARQWLRDAATVQYANARKGKRLLVATSLLVAGLAGLIVNYLVAKPSEKPVPTLRVIVASPPPDAASPAPRGLPK